MVLAPLFTENLTFFVDLAVQVTPQVEQFLLELFLKVIQSLVESGHLLCCVLAILLYLTASRTEEQLDTETPTYVYTLVKRCSSLCFDAILAFFMSSKSWLMSFICPFKAFRF